MNAYQSYFASHSDNDEYLRDFKRPEPAGRRTHCERVLNRARKVRHLSWRSLSHLLRQLSSVARRKARKVKEQSHKQR